VECSPNLRHKLTVLVLMVSEFGTAVLMITVFFVMFHQKEDKQSMLQIKGYYSVVLPDYSSEFGLLR